MCWKQTGPVYFMITDLDGNSILVGQHAPRPAPLKPAAASAAALVRIVAPARRSALPT